ncbi:MAG: hypothetical protein NVSMB38_32060 [Ktedonobacteraceae bacterium]
MLSPTSMVEKDFDSFKSMRKSVHRLMQERIERRLDRDQGRPTDFELELDALTEEIEPQVWGAVKTFNEKGYKTESSGFYGKNAEYQAIDGPFQVSRRARENLAQIGVVVEQLKIPGVTLTNCSIIKFYPSAPNLKMITETWNRVAAMLPMRKQPRRCT